MANEQNLIPQAHKLTVEEASKGGIASGEARRRKKALRELVQEAFAQTVRNNATGQDMRTDEAMVMKQVQKALEGDTKAFTVLRDTAGELPVQRVETVEISPETYERVARALEGD